MLKKSPPQAWRRKQHSERKRAAGAVRNVLALVKLRLGYLKHVATRALPVVHALLLLEGHLREKHLLIGGVVIVSRVCLSHGELRVRLSSGQKVRVAVPRCWAMHRQLLPPGETPAFPPAGFEPRIPSCLTLVSGPVCRL